MVHWLLSLQLPNKRKDVAWELLQEKTASFGSSYKLEVPELRVGTLDSLMALSDDLSKTSAAFDAVVAKIRRQVYESGSSKAIASLKVEGMAAETYVQRFKWDEAKFPARRPLKETVEKMTELISRIEDDLKVKASEYNNLKSQLSQFTRKAQGSLAVRDIHQLVQPQQVIDTEHLTTLFVIVTKFSAKDWKDGYEKMCDFIVPRSSELIAEDNESAMFSVVLFKRVVDDFKAAARSRGFQVREYHMPLENSELSATQLEQLKRDVEQRKAALETWCRTAFGEAFSCYVHALVVRLFVESILRYGLPPAFQAVVVRPLDKAEGKLRAELESAFGDGKTQFWKDEGSTVGAGLAGDLEMYPYVSLTLTTEYNAA
ncbi:ATPvC1 [Gonium pectorale]|uniref:V-type proton ATPase subunit C n=1 Tax=Gonium pectorale TaxID=33097 RepID=A0A140JWU6_GONPE|nr:ATPvC1 [Gonium pectorale]BAU61573.1 vacuolar H+ ATPase V1 sector, subunit C [Gonium pectorale]BAU61605.1 vacuolar H+ ATPase V1 sector, subunit C [Gonium pectorale]|eukprot:KXZ57041.1 ATPvC1 [Gonium pectorale]